MRVTFLRDEIYETEGRKSGHEFKAGEAYDFTDDFAGRWTQRGAAEVVPGDFKAELVGSLIKNTACAFSKAELEAMELPFLEKVAAGMGVSYAGASVPRTNTRTTDIVDNDELPPDPPAVLTAPVTAAK